MGTSADSIYLNDDGTRCSLGVLGKRNKMTLHRIRMRGKNNFGKHDLMMGEIDYYDNLTARQVREIIEQQRAKL